jgi:hypothetical protein
MGDPSDIAEVVLFLASTRYFSSTTFLFYAVFL